MNSLFIICKFLVHKNDLNPEIEKLWLPLWYTATWNQKSVGASTRWNSIIICKILVYKIGPVPEIGKCGCLYEIKLYIHHLQNFGMQEWSCPLNWKMCLPLWDEILYSSFAKFRYTTMTLTLKSKKCGCLYEMKFYIHHLQNFGIQQWPWPWNRKSVVASMRWNSTFIIC